MIYRKLQRAYWTVYWGGFPDRVPQEQGQDYMTSRLAAIFGLFLLLVSGVAVAQTPVVEDIRVEGNQRIEAETVRSYMNLRRGTPLTPAAVNRALKGLFGTGLFSDVKMGQDGSTIVVQVVENPIINRLAFEGNKKLDDEVLAAEIQLRPRIVYTRAKVQSDVQRLLQVYRASGRFSARIEPKIIQLPQNRIDLVYEITEGDTTEIRSIRILGNKAFSDGTLKEVISTRESAFWRLLGSSDVYSQGRVELDQALLDGYYKDRGYYDFRVVSANVELTPDQKAFFITYTVEEGEKYNIRKIDVATNLKNTNPKELRALIEAEPGDTYSAKEIGKINKILKDAVGGKGFAFVNIREQVKPDREKRTLDITFNIGQGRRNYIERINISGNTRTLDEVIRREIKLVEGDAYDAAQIQRSERRIRALGFFADAKLKTEQGSAADKAIINVEVEEQPTGELSVGAGFSTAEALIGDVSLRERNFLGRGQDVRLAFSLSLRRRQLDFSFTEPYFMDMPISAGIDLFNTNSDFQSQSSFTQKSIGGKLRTGMSLTDALRLTLDYGLRQDEIADVDANASQFIQQQAGVATTSRSVRGSRTHPGGRAGLEEGVEPGTEDTPAGGAGDAAGDATGDEGVRDAAAAAAARPRCDRDDTSTTGGGARSNEVWPAAARTWDQLWYESSSNALCRIVQRQQGSPSHPRNTTSEAHDAHTHKPFGVDDTTQPTQPRQLRTEKETRRHAGQ